MQLRAAGEREAELQEPATLTLTDVAAVAQPTRTALSSTHDAVRRLGQHGVVAEARGASWLTLMSWTETPPPSRPRSA